MSTDSADQELDRELAQEQLVTAVMRGRLALITGDDEPVSEWLGEIAVTLADETEVVRVDASETHTANGVVQALVRALDVTPDDLLDVLARRGEMLPLVLVVDNAECLSSRGLDALRNLLAKGQGGLGVLMGGEPESAELLARARIQPAYHSDATTSGASEASEPAGEKPAGWLALLPWKHLLAVAGLLLLVWIFWPVDGDDQDRPKTDKLALPEPSAPRNDSDTPRDGAGTDPPGAAGAGESASAGNAGRPDQASGTEASGSLREPAPNPSVSADGGEPADESREKPAEESAQESSEPGRADGSGPSGLEADLAYRREDWLLTRSPDHWMLQLALAADEARARELLDRLGPDRGAYYRARREGEAVYIVLSGPYGSRDQALGARSGLPGFFRERGPFPRSIAAIADEIRD